MVHNYSDLYLKSPLYTIKILKKPLKQSLKNLLYGGALTMKHNIEGEHSTYTFLAQARLEANSLHSHDERKIHFYQAVKLTFITHKLAGFSVYH